MVQALEDSRWLKFTLYFAFTSICALLVLLAGPETPYAASSLAGALYATAIAVGAVIVFHVCVPLSGRRSSRILLVFGALVLQLCILRGMVQFTTGGLIPRDHLLLSIPYILVPLLHGILLGRAIGAFSVVVLTMVGCLLIPAADSMSYLLLSLSSGMASVLMASNVRKRLQVLKTGLYAGLLIVLLCFMLGRLNLGSAFGPNAMDHLQVLGEGMLIGLSVTIFTALLTSGFLPIFENFFHLSTNISWLELGDLNHQLLRRMQLEAPGTFHHSLIVAALAEAAAETIGANAPMCRVCAYFHDVGKLKKPGYFIENLHDGGENPHDALTPTMSALVIIAHVKDGVDLALKHKLNPRIIDIIQEHHGDSLVAYFYRRAQEQKKVEMQKVDRKLGNPEDLPTIDEKNFRYPGPRPSTRESAIIALADTIESASRTLRKPTPAKIKAMIEELVQAKLQDGQLDNCPITLQELVKIKQSFATTLRSMLHSRIDYPKDDDNGPLTSRPGPGDRFLADQDRVIMMPKRA